MRGAPGSGKSTLIKENDLSEYAICPDDIRLYFGGIKYNLSGIPYINQEERIAVWQLVEEVIDNKMSNGEFIILDSTLQRTEDFKMPLNLAKKYHYEVYCLDLSKTSEDIVQERNQQREPYRIVPKETISLIYERFIGSSIPDEVKLISNFSDVLEMAISDLSPYKRVHHIGDLHGSFDLEF